MVVILYRWWAKGEKDQLGKPGARCSRTQGTGGADSGDCPRASGTTTRSDDHRHCAYLDLGVECVDCGRPTGAAPIPSFTASNSQNAMAGPLVSPAEAVFVSPAPARALELNAPGCTPAGTSAASGPFVNCTPAVGGASTLAELDAIITVTN